MSVQVENITKRYGSQLALNNVSFSLDKGEITGFLGPNGAGKSTLMKIITGYLTFDSGQVTVSGFPVGASEIAFRSRIGYLPEHTPLYPEMYIKEYLEVVAGFYKMKGVKHRIAEVIDMTGLTPESHKKIGALSKGYRQRVGLAQALIHNPEVLILDEPTSGLDPNQLEEIRNLVRNISSDKTVLLSTHIMQEVEAVCGRIIIINKGELVADGSTDEIRAMSKSQGQKVRITTLELTSSSFWENLPYISNATQITEREFLLTAKGSGDIRPQVFHSAVDNGLTLIALQEEAQSIENIFRELTQIQ
jgi:ABC-2 type transport system ATP-binding protein